MQEQTKPTRIGIASSDGIVVNQHFGRASEFLIYDLDEDNQLHLIEKRSMEPICEKGNHDSERLDENIQKLKDCKYLLVSRIGQGANAALEQNHISAFEIPGILQESVDKMLAYIEIQKMLGYQS